MQYKNLYVMLPFFSVIFMFLNYIKKHDVQPSYFASSMKHRLACKS